MTRLLPTLLLFLLASISVLPGCKKTDPSPEARTKGLLVGHWELVYSSGGIGGGPYPADPARKQEVIFDAGGQAKLLLNGVVARTSPYFLKQAVSLITDEPQIFLFYGTPDFSSKGFIKQTSAERFVLVEDYYDGMSYHYSRR